MNQRSNRIQPAATDPVQVLLMDDDASVSRGLEMVLRDEGYGVDVAMTGQGALDASDHKPFDLLVADLRLPDMDGMEVVKRFRRDRPKTKVIVITGYANVPSAVESIQCGAVDYLAKPFTADAFLQKVQEALGKTTPSAVEMPSTIPDGVETPAASAQVPAPLPPSGPSVLVVEDESSIARGLLMILGEAHYTAVWAKTGQEALERLTREDFDLLVADLRLPDMHGLDVISRARQMKPGTKAMVITGYADVSSAVRAMRMGVVDYLSKPFTEERFLDTVSRTLDVREQAFAGDMFASSTRARESGGPIRAGVYVCHGGADISGKVDVAAVVRFFSRQPGVAVARSHASLCDENGLASIEKDIAQLALNRVVVAACEPTSYQQKFQTMCQRAGLKPHQFQMASIREQVAWVAADPDEALNKAKTLVAAALHRAIYHRTQATREVPVNPNVLVVGGGIAGMQASLDIAGAGNQVYLVERDSTIGGHMLQFDKTFPTLDCAACIGTPKMVEVAQNAHIKLFSLSAVAAIRGVVGNYRVTIRRQPRYIREDLCTGCGECVKVCPVSLPNDWDQGMGMRKAIGRTFPQAIPIAYTIAKKDRAPCANTCPAGVNVQGYVQLIGQGKYREALELILRRVPMPGTLGRVCPHPCESRCRRAEVDAPVAIRALKRFAADQVDLAGLPLPRIEPRSEKVAVVGSGPAGLTVAYYLALKGYPVTLFEALDQLGGMLRVGIPDYRLPPRVLDQEIAHILRAGVCVRRGMRLGRDFTLDDLRQQGFKAVFLGIGAHSGMSLNIPGESAFAGIVDAVAFLRGVNLAHQTNPGERVLVIGGGNVAVDAARAAKRLGSKSVTLVYRRTAREMPAYVDEIAEAQEEGIDFEYLTVPQRILGSDGRVSGLACLRAELGAPDADGRRRPVALKDSAFVMACDAVIPAIGQISDPAAVAGLEWTARNTLKVDPHTYQTSRPGVFAAGDLVSGPATVVEAVGAAHRVVAAMEAFLRDTAPETATANGALPPAKAEWVSIPEKIAPTPRGEPGKLAAPQRVGNFDEVQAALSDAQARAEAARCLNCGACSECMECVKVCEAQAIDHTMTAEEIEVDVGSVILATGYDTLDPTPLKPYGYGRYPNVFTALEFERLSNATGPTGGEIRIRDANGELTRTPRSVAILHCAGSRDVNYHEYCSRVCCMYALKYGHLIKEKTGSHTTVTNFYIDMRCFGKGHEAFYRRCQEEGIHFVRGKPAQIDADPNPPDGQDRLVVIGEDTLLNRLYRLPVDMVILCTAIEARKDAAAVAEIFGIRTGQDGFFQEQHSRIAPLNTAVEGIFLAGACQTPKDIADTVAQASGAASRALALAMAGRVEIPYTIAWIDPERCAGCRACIPLCTASAIVFDASRSVSAVNQAICSGCGICVSACPNGAAHIWQFTEDRIMTEFDYPAARRQVG
jgi:heterodisulfide reductase subunit A2